MTLTWRDLATRAGIAILVGVALLVTLAVAWLVPDQPMMAVGLAGALMVGVLALVNPVVLPLLAMPLIVVVQRVGGGAIDLTASDAILALAFWPAVVLGPRPLSPELRRLLWLNAVYQGLTLFTLLANPFLANTVEWFHAWLLVSGALVVGWAVGASGHGRLGMSLFLLACLALAVPAILQGLLQYAGGNFGAVYPRWPWPMHKNFIGNLLGVAALVAYARPPWLGWSRRAAFAAFGVLVAGVAVSQSRQALVGLAIGLIIVSFRKQDGRRRATLALAAVIPIAYVILTMVRDQIASGNVHNSWFQRLTWYTESLAIWQQSPWFGHGLRYWTQPEAPGAFQPPNAFLEVAASAGVVGLLGFLVMWGGFAVVLYRVDPAFGTLALALAVSRLAQAQLDLFWVSVSVSAPFLLVGLCLGQQAWQRTSEHASSRPAMAERV